MPPITVDPTALDFILAHEPTARDIAYRFHFDPAVVPAAGEKLAPAEQ